MDDNKNANYTIKNFWILDVLVVVFFLSTAAISLQLFRLDLFRTLDARDEEPAGIIIIKNNIVQRRYADRTIWDRLSVDSPVYSGDLIRVADLSNATIDLDENKIGLNENTIILIEQSMGEKGSFQIELKEGNLNVTSTDTGPGIMLNLMGRFVQTAPGAVLNAAAGEEGITVQVNEGSVSFIEEGNVRELTEGTMISQDANGVERIVPAAVVRRPAPNARFLKTSPDPYQVNFSWNRMNLEPEQTLRMEIAGDSNFTRNFSVVEDLGSFAQIDFDIGLWNWRLLHEDSVLSKGQLTIADGSGPDLLSPVAGSVFRYQNELPNLRFQWSERPGASHYILEISATNDFNTPLVSRELSALSYIYSDLESGTWYWRVQPVFPSVFQGSGAYSSAASFRIEKTSDPRATAIEVPDPPAKVQVSEQPVIKPPEPPAIRPPESAALTRPVPGQRYRVRRGDTLADITWQAYGSTMRMREIVRANNIRNPNLIEIGEIFYIPE
jgi:phage tail protein X